MKYETLCAWRQRHDRLGIEAALDAKSLHAARIAIAVEVIMGAIVQREIVIVLSVE